MSIDFPKPSLDLLDKYVTFWTGFWWPPAAPLRSYKEGGDPGELLYFVVAGITLAYAITLIATRIGTKADRGNVLRFVRKFSLGQLPLVTIVLILVSASISHLFARVWIFFERFGRPEAGPPVSWDPYLPGTLLDSIHAALGFAAFFIPIITFVLSFDLVVERAAPNAKYLAGVAGLVCAGLFVVYFPGALAASHGVTYGQAAMAFSGSVVLMTLLLWVIFRDKRAA